MVSRLPRLPACTLKTRVPGNGCRSPPPVGHMDQGRIGSPGLCPTASGRPGHRITEVGSTFHGSVLDPKASGTHHLHPGGGAGGAQS